MNKPRLGMALIVLTLCLPAHAEETPDADEGTKIIGTDESPSVLNVIPWQDRELGGSPAGATRNVRSVLDDALKPVDRHELRRENQYFETLRDNRQDAGSAAE